MPLSRKIVTSEKALARLEELCVRGERCESELRTKLRTWQIASADADAVIDSLRRRRFFDDARFAHAFVTDKVRFARWGRIKIAMALRYKRIDSDIIAEALTEIDERAYIEALEAVIAAAVRRIGDDAAHTYEGRTRVFRAAVSRGFESDISAATIRRHLADRRD